MALLWSTSLERARHELEARAEAAAQQANSLTRVFEAQTAKTLKNIDLGLELVARNFAVGGRSLEVQQLLASKLLDERTSRELVVLDVRGRVVASVNELVGLDMSDREYFTTLRDSPDLDFYVGTPIRSRASSKWIIPLARRLVGTNGEFTGVVGCGVDPAYFIDFYRHEDLNSQGVVTLLGTDGFTRARRAGPIDSFGEDVRHGRLLELARARPAGDFLGSDGPDGVVRFQSYRTLPDYHLIVSVGLSSNEALAEAQRRNLEYRHLAILATVYILAFGAAIIFVSTRRHRDQQRSMMLQLQRQAILDNITDVAWFKDTHSRFLAVNRAFMQLCNREMHEIIGKTDADLFPAEIAQGYVAHDLRIMKEGGRQVVEEKLPQADGQVLTIETVKTRVRDADGRLLGTVGIARDITSRRREEAQRRLSAKAFESIADGLLVTDEKKRIVSVNNALCTITGYQPEELLGHTPKLLQSGRHDAEFYEAMWREIDSTGRWRGEIWDRRKNGEIFPELLSISAVHDDTGRLIHYVGVCTDISSLKEYEAKLRYQAHHDALTGLPNRFQFQEKFEEMLARAGRHGWQVAVMMLDLDRFKHVNDSLGHAAGDQLLQQVAARLSSCLRKVDVVGRFGGDEFAVLLDKIASTQSAAIVAGRLLQAFSEPFSLSGHEIFVSCSIGITCFPSDATAADVLLKYADAAMYRAKGDGRNSYQYFSAEINARALDNLLLSSGLRLAIERDELVLHYQPRIDLSTGLISGAEALVRWQHPEHGLLPPIRFIPIAEEMGLIDAVGDWVLKEACRQMRRWREAGVLLERVAVNLAARQFSQANFCAGVA
ncbi:MAG TPA: diguanylate cyclase, partial [Polyangiaceae bacterium]|nr:diguanylate cyclase [Polyangiaceae bacterium]